MMLLIGEGCRSQCSQCYDMLKQQVIDEIIRLRAQGLTLNAIAAQLGISDSTVDYRLKHPVQKHRGLTEERIQLIKSLRAQGKTITEIRQLVRVSLHVVVEHVKGIALPKRKRCAGQLNRVSTRIVKRKVLIVPAICKFCSSAIEIVIDNKPTAYEFSLKLSKRFVTCSKCDTCFSIEELVSRQEVNAKWWGQLPQDDDDAMPS
jgi:DNA-binding transcriptional MerR regulator